MSRKNDDELPEWLKSVHQESENLTEPTESPEAGPRKRSRSASSKVLLRNALVMLGITQADLDTSPKIEHLLGRIDVFQYLEGSEEPEARQILELRKRLTDKQRSVVPFEAYCVAAVIPVKKMFGIISAECMDQEDKAKQLLFRATHKQVLQATIDSALDPIGVADRKMLHQAANFVPVPKNSVTFVRGNQMIDASTKTTNIAVLPPVEDTVRRLGDRFNEKVLDVLPAPESLQIESGDDEDEE